MKQEDLWSTESSSLKPGQSVRRAGSEVFCFDPEMSEDLEPEIAKRRRVFRIKRKVVAVPECTAAYENGQVGRIVT